MITPVAKRGGSRSLRALLPILTGCAALLGAAGNAFGGPATASFAAAAAAPAAPASLPSAGAPTPTPMLEASGALREPEAVLFDPFLSELEERTFRYFWDTANPKNGLIPDRYPTPIG